jgi:hypothetical protein
MVGVSLGLMECQKLRHSSSTKCWPSARAHKLSHLWGSLLWYLVQFTKPPIKYFLDLPVTPS